jgi:hypothetical protein
MRNSPDKSSPGRRLLNLTPWACAIAVAMASALSPVQAQSQAQKSSGGGPILLFPGAGGANDNSQAAAPAAAPRGIQVDRLDAGAIDSLGILDVADGGLGYDLWRGSSRDEILRLIPLLPAEPSTPARRSLAVRLLLSSAAPPSADSASAQVAGADAAPSTQPGLLSVRADRLLAMGEVAGLRELLRVIPQNRGQSPDLAKLSAEAAFLAEDNEQACATVRNSVGLYPDDEFWNEALIYCQIIAGDTDAAALGTDLLRERGGSHPDFVLLASALLGYGKAPVLETSRPLDIAMLADLKALPADDNSLPPAALGLRLAAASPLERAAIAEAAAETGALSGLELAQLYREISFTEAELGAALSLAPTMTEGTRIRALLFQAAERPGLPAARAELLQVFLQDGRSNALPLATAHAGAALVDALPPSPELAWFSAVAGKILLLEGRSEGAAAWLTLARRQAVGSAEARAAAVALQPYAQLAGLDSSRPAAGSWQEAWAESASEEDEILLGILLQSLGQGPEPDWGRLIAGADTRATGTAEGGSGPLTAAIYGAQTAARGGQRGEAVIFALIALSPAAAASATDPLVLGPSIAAVAASGLDRPAQALAIEAAYLADL